MRLLFRGGGGEGVPFLDGVEGKTKGTLPFVCWGTTCCVMLCSAMIRHVMHVGE